jgi:hypothetical protein
MLVILSEIPSTSTSLRKPEAESRPEPAEVKILKFGLRIPVSEIQ